MNQSYTKIVIENQKLKRDNVQFQRIIKRLAMDLSIVNRVAVPRIILWPAGLKEVEPLLLGIGKGKDVLTPEERLRHIERPVAEVDDATVLMLMQRPAAAAAPEPDAEAHSPLCSAQAGPRSECHICGPKEARG